MEIKRNKDGLIVSDNTNMILISEKQYSGDNYKIVFTKEFKGDGFWVTGPGEFEISGISVLSQSSKKNDEVDIVEFIIDDVSVIYVKSTFEYDKQIHDNLGQVHVLVLEIKEDKPVTNLISKFDPELFVPIGEKELVKKVLGDSGVSIFSEEKKFKEKSDKFGNENAIMETVIIE